jgi:hypothetical protein
MTMYCDMDMRFCLEKGDAEMRDVPPQLNLRSGDGNAARSTGHASGCHHAF